MKFDKPFEIACLDHDIQLQMVPYSGDADHGECTIMLDDGDDIDVWVQKLTRWVRL